MHIGIATDDAGSERKEELIIHLGEAWYEAVNRGAYSRRSVCTRSERRRRSKSCKENSV